MKRRAVQLLASSMAICLLALPAAVLGQSTTAETVFFTGPDNQISTASFGACPVGPGSSTAVITDGGTNLKGIVVRANPLCIVAANSTNGGELRMYAPTAPPPSRNLGRLASFDSAVAVDIDSSENVFAVNDDPGGADQLLFVPRNATNGCSIAGYDGPRVLDSQVGGAFRLADVKFVRVSKPGAVYAAGDALVLVRSLATGPGGKLVKYTSDAISAALASNPPQDAVETPVAEVDLSAVEPTSFAVIMGGDILVATNGGQVLRFGANGAPKGTFASFPGSGVDLATGLKGGAEKVFLTIHQGGSVQLLNLDGTCSGVVTGANSPVGVGNASLNLKGSVFTPASTGQVTVAPTSAQQMTFEKVNLAGNTTSTAFAVTNGCTDFAAPFTLTLAGVSRVVPSYVKPFDRAGCPTFLVYVVDTDADFFGATVEDHIEENAIGFDTTCYAGGSPFGGDPPSPGPGQPRTFYATDGDDPAIVEGNSFTDISSGCGSNIGRGGERSLILLGWDERSTNDIASSKLSSLDLALNGNDPCTGGLAPFIPSRTRRTLNNHLQDAIAKFNAAQGALAEAALDNFISAVQSGNIKNCVKRSRCAPCRNAPGELIARAVSAQFMICGAGNGCNRRLTP